MLSVLTLSHGAHTQWQNSFRKNFKGFHKFSLKARLFFLEKEVSNNELIKIPFPWRIWMDADYTFLLCIQNRNTNTCSSVKRIFSIVFYSFLGWPVTTKIEGKIMFYRILQINWLQNWPFHRCSENWERWRGSPWKKCSKTCLLCSCGQKFWKVP